MTQVAVQQDSDEDERRRLGDRLREARKYLGLKQEEVATYLKIPRTALTDIESGQRRVEALELTRLAKLYRQPVGFFTGEDEGGGELAGRRRALGTACSRAVAAGSRRAWSVRRLSPVALAS